MLMFASSLILRLLASGDRAPMVPGDSSTSTMAKMELLDVLCIVDIISSYLHGR